MRSIATNCMPKVVSDLLAPHTSGPRDVPRCGALSLLSKDAALQGGVVEIAATLNVELCDLCGGGGGGGILPLILAQSSFESI
jgi:hypothetical protein